MSATATPPRSSRRQAMSSAPPSPYADTKCPANGSPLRRSRGFASNLSSCAGEEGQQLSTDSPTFHVRKCERISQWRSHVGGASPYTPMTHSALARAIDSGDESDESAGGRARPIAPLAPRVLVQDARTPPPSSHKLNRDLSKAFTLSPAQQPSSSPLSAKPLRSKITFRPELQSEPMRRYNSLPTPPTHYSPSRVPRSIGLYDLNLHATPPKSKYQAKKLDLGGPLTPSPEGEEQER